MSMNLSQIIGELFARPMESKEQTSRIQHLGDEIRKVIYSEETVFGKFQGLLESFRAIIPDEKQRFQAALQALSTMSKLGRREIIKAINGQAEELKILEKGVMPAQAAWRDGLKTMESRSQQVKAEIAQLRARLVQLEGEEATIQAGMAAQERDLALAEKTVKELFTNIGAEISSLGRKLEELTGEAPAAQLSSPARQPAPAKEPLSEVAPPEKKKEEIEEPDALQPTPPLDSKFQRKCPVCGGATFNLLELEKKWQCYTCAYEEAATDEEKSELRSGQYSEAAVDTSSSSAEHPASESGASGRSKRSSSQPDDQPPTKKKDCPVCSKSMFWHSKEKAWRCPSCQYERRI